MIHNLTQSTLLAIKQAVHDAENKKQEPAYIVDIYRSVVDLGHFANPSITEVRKALFDLYRNDELLADEQMNRFTLEFETHERGLTSTGYESCSRRMERKFSMYKFDEKRRIVPMLATSQDFD